MTPRSNKSLTTQSNKRRHTHFRPIADYIAIYVNSPLGVPHSKLFADKHEYGYFRWVIHQWKHGKLTGQPNKQGVAPAPSPLSSELLVESPVDVHSTPWRCEVPSYWIPKFKDMVVSRNRNGQLVYRDPQGYFGLVVHKRGSVQFTPYFNVKTAWDRLEAYVKDCLGEDGARLFLEGLHKSGVKTHVAFHTPGVTKFAVKIPGVANIESDKTPWRDGTSEVIIDTKDITNTVREMNKVMGKVLQNELAFSENLKLHLETIQAMKGTAETMKEGMTQFAQGVKEGITQLSDAARALTQAANRIAEAPESATSRATSETPKEQSAPATVEPPTEQASPKNTLDTWSQLGSQPRQAESHDCVHGWTPEMVEQNYSTGLSCGRCMRIHSCKVVESAYELARQKDKEKTS